MELFGERLISLSGAVLEGGMVWEDRARQHVANGRQEQDLKDWELWEERR